MNLLKAVLSGGQSVKDAAANEKPVVVNEKTTGSEAYTQYKSSGGDNGMFYHTQKKK